VNTATLGSEQRDAPAGVRRRSPWVWVGCGCGVLVLLGALAFGGFLFMMVREGKEAERVSRDPVLLAQRVQQVVHYRDLPPPYRPVTTFSIPFFLQLAIFADRELESRGAMSHNLPPDASSFIVVRTYNPFGTDWRKRATIHTGPAPDWMKNIGVEFRSSSQVRSETIQLQGHAAEYRALRSHLVSHGKEWSSIMAVAVLDCQDRHWIHTLVWSTPDPAPDKPLAETTGTPADPDALQQMVSHFELCADGGKGSGQL
jgi:hypothetical protein